jgi:hypothetical protein
MQHLEENPEKHCAVIISLQHALVAVDQFDPVIYAEAKRIRLKNKHKKQ